MHKGDAIPVIHSDANLKSALVEMTEKKLGMTTVINRQGELVGIFTDGDLRRTLDSQADIHATRIESIMASKPKTIDAHELDAQPTWIAPSFMPMM